MPKRPLSTSLRTILAGRVEELRRKYTYEAFEHRPLSPEQLDQRQKLLPREIFDQILALDPTPTKKYLGWMLKVYGVHGHQDMAEYEAVPKFDQLVQRNRIRGEQADIYRYKTLEQVWDLVRRFEGTQTKSEESRTSRNKGAELVFANARAAVYNIRTREASCLYGAHTKWCTAATSSFNHFNSYFYQQGVNLYYIIPKGPYLEKYGKIAIAVSRTGSPAIFDAKDNVLSKTRAAAIFKDLKVPFGEHDVTD